MTARRTAAGVLALGLHFVPPAAAETKAMDWLAGGWRFETGRIDDACTISGRMTITPTADPARFDCRFESRQLCERTPPIDIRMSQTCTAAVSGEQIAISSRLAAPLSVKPESFAASIMRTYAPDNFIVSPASHDELTGVFHSQRRAFVRFRREVDLLS